MSQPEFSMADVNDLPSVRQTLEQLVELNGGNLNSFSLWRSAWEHGMAICGHPNAMLYHIIQSDPRDDSKRQVTYGWESDTDEYIHAWLERDHWHPGTDVWDDAHEVFVLVDIVRPEYIMPSLALERLLRREQSGDN